MHRCNALGQWAMDLVQYTAALPRGTGRWHCCSTLPHYLGAMGNGTHAIHLGTAYCTRPHRLAQWALELLLFRAALPCGIGKWISCCLPPQCLGAMGS